MVDDDYSNSRLALTLYYAKARYYDPVLGLFLTEDPFVGEVQTPPSLHRYLYAYQNPTVWVDPTGRQNETVEYRWTDEGDIPPGTEYFVSQDNAGNTIYYNTDRAAWPKDSEAGFGVAEARAEEVRTKEAALWQRAWRAVTESARELGTSLEEWGEGFDERQAEQMQRGPAGRAGLPGRRAGGDHLRP